MLAALQHTANGDINRQKFAVEDNTRELRLKFQRVGLRWPAVGDSINCVNRTGDERMAFKGVDHVVVRVADLEAAIGNYSKMLDIEPERKHSEELKADQAFYHFGDGPFLELISPTDDASPISGPLAKRGEGIHTIALAVDSAKETASNLDGKGVRTIGEAFVHPGSANGVLVQLSER